MLCSGRIAKEAAIYPRALVKACIRGVINQMKRDGMIQQGVCGLQPACDEDRAEAESWALRLDHSDNTLLDNEGATPATGDRCNTRLPPATGQSNCSGKYRDDISKQLLVDSLVHEARRKELEYFASKGVWVKLPRQECFKATGKSPISVRWVDVNKGDDEHPRYRSRLVARQLKALEGADCQYFAPSPPLEALRTVLSLARTRVGKHKPIQDPHDEDRTQISTLDISRAYFNAVKDADDVTFVELPPEDPDAGPMVAKLQRHMYGTRGAADGWQEEYSTKLVSLGFAQGRSSPCLFVHSERQLYCSVHGDDFTTTGGKRSLDWFEQEMSKFYELTIGPRLGPGLHDAKECSILNRIVRWTEDAVEYEADPRQVEKLIRECGLEGANSVATPGMKDTAAQVASDTPLDDKLHTAFRASAARANYLAADRVDCQYSEKGICRWMSAPTTSAWNALKRLVRYLVGLPRLVYRFEDQEVDAVDVYTDSDWAGCSRTRKSTSGGCIMLGKHTIKTWSSTQTGVALSSGEAEFNGVIRASGMGLGFQSLLSDLGVALPLRVWTDSSAAIGICSRQGLGKLRHIDTHLLWVQQAVRSRRIDLRKVAGESNPADLYTKHLPSREKLLQLVGLTGCTYQGGRAHSAPQTRTAESGKTTIADADLNACESDVAVPSMPHLECSSDRLDFEYPSLSVPSEIDDCHETDWDSWDKVYARGLEIIEQIRTKTVNEGRRRCEPPTTPLTPGPQRRP